MATHSVGERVQAKILKHSVREIGKIDAVEVQLELSGGEVVSALIFLTERSMGIARSMLRACGFDADTRSLAELITRETALAGNFVDIEAEEYNQKIQWKIRTARKVPKSRLLQHDAALRAAKERDDVLAPAAPEEPPPLTDDDIPF